MGPGSPQVNAGRLRGRVAVPDAAGSSLELDFDENELEIVRIDDVVLDADLAGIGHAGPSGAGTVVLPSKMCSSPVVTGTTT